MSAIEQAFTEGFVNAPVLTWTNEEGYRVGRKPASEAQVSRDPEATTNARRVGESEYRRNVRLDYERVGPPEGMNYFEGWRDFLNREEAAGKHPKWFWDGFIRTSSTARPT